VKNLLFAFLFLSLTLAITQGVNPSEQKPGTKQMKVGRVNVDPLAGQSVVILQDMKGTRVIPIWIGFSEANAIALQINGIVPPRPMTHDLIRSILEGLHTRVDHVLIHDVRENIIYARIILNLNDHEITIDSRPSDAIALAVRVKAPILVTDQLYNTLSVEMGEDEEGNQELSV
jgi:bifunctional DNase/RNase